jgi:hypothetical protein
MKIRIRGNSIRLRLTRPEIDVFEKEGFITEMTSFPQGKLSYTLRRSDAVPAISASFMESGITVSMPTSMAQQWVGTEKVGYDARVDTPGGDGLYILIEKDFKCLDETIEDQSDNFDNPLAAARK